MPVTAAYLIIFLPIFFYHVSEFEKENHRIAKSLREMKEHFNASGKTIVLANSFDFIYYPSGLFSELYDKRIPHFNLDFTFMGRFSKYLEHNKPFFDEEIPYLEQRMMKCANNERVVFISKDDYNAFLKGYLKTFHDLDIEIKPIEVDFKLYELKPYFIVAEEKQRQQN